MKIYTSYFGQLRNLSKDNITPIAICRYLPKYYTGLVYQNIAPSADILEKCRSSHFEYTERFNKEILDKLNPLNVYHDICKLSGNSDCALLCYESFDDTFCHRWIVSEWLNKNIPNLNITEYNPNIQNLNPLF